MSPVEAASPRGSRRESPAGPVPHVDRPGNGLTAREILAVVGLTAIAIAARGLVMAATPASAPISDMAEYWLRGVHLYEHGTLYPDSWRMPGLPVWLATLFTLGGGVSVDVARAGNVAAGAVTTALTWWLARRGSSRRGALAAAAIVALYPTLLLYTSLVATEAVVAVPLLGACIAATYTTRRAAVVLGLCTAAALLVRPAAVALIPAALVALRWTRDDAGEATGDHAGEATGDGVGAATGTGDGVGVTTRSGDGVHGAARAGAAAAAPAARRARSVLFAVALVVAMLPWWRHNASLHGRFVPLDTTGGLNLLIGSGPTATGRWDYALVSALQATVLAGVDPATPAGSDRASALAWAHVAAHPLAWLSLVPAKLTGLFAFEGRETAYLYSIGFFGAHASAVVGLWAAASVLAFPLLFVAAAFGFARGAVAPRVARPAAAFVAATAILHLATFGDPRFHLPFVPVLAVVATGAWRAEAGARGGRRWLAAAVCAVMAVAWYAQLVHSMPFIRLLIAPGGWQRPVSFDDLL